VSRPGAILAAILFAVAVASAHEPPKTTTRELVRLQGFRRADGDAPAGRMTLRALGVEQPFAATDRRVFGLVVEGDAAPKPADRYALQGPRALLARFAGAGPGDTVSILGEHHPGSEDLFVLAVDVCPGR